MRPRIVYVHGNGNKVRPELLKSQWDTALFGEDMADVSRMAYWASLRYDAPLPDFRPDPLDGAPDGELEAPVTALVEPTEEFVAKVRAQARSEAGPGLEGMPGADAAGEEALDAWLRGMTYFADTLAEGAAEDAGADAGSFSPLEALPLPRIVRDPVFRLLVKHTFKDVHAYFFSEAGQAIREVVKDALDGLDGAPLVVVGHSLGTIVAYEVLSEEKTDVDLFVTVGSPLAITEVRDRLARPPAVPVGVVAWRNASDLRDVVALDHTLAQEYAPSERITDLLVTNDSANHHGISQYLSAPPVREPVRRLFESSAGG
ncbi:hypothetical protein AB0K71_01770 [Streptomyces syringium]|uniref:hypothetical protein n=1 Tax=Streptomyces syringium TaxID=76729 RepID=UPI00342B3F56